MDPCESFLLAISQSLDGLLSPQEQHQLEGHLARCQGCLALYQELSLLRGVLREVGETAPPPQLLGGTMEQIAQLPSLPGRRRSTGWAWGLGAAACAALCTLLYGGLVGERQMALSTLSLEGEQVSGMVQERVRPFSQEEDLPPEATQLTLTELPEEVMPMLPALEQWNYEDPRGASCILSREELEGLCEALLLLGVPFVPPPTPWTPQCQVLLLS